MIFLASFSTSGFCIISLVYTIEISNKNIRVTAPAIFYSLSSFSIILIALLTYINSDILFTLLVITAIPPLIMSVSLKFICESPRYLVANQNYADAYTSLKQIAEINEKFGIPNLELYEHQQQKFHEE